MEWGFQYALVDRTGKHDLAELRTLNDWYVQYCGGFVKQYQIEVDPNALVSYKIPLDTVVANVRKSNNDVGGRVVEWTGREYMVRGRGYIKRGTASALVKCVCTVKNPPARCDCGASR